MAAHSRRDFLTYSSLANEVLIPITKKDRFHGQEPRHDSQYAKYVAHPEVSRRLPAVYPNVFPNLAALNASRKPRADLEAILLTGISAGIIPHFQNYTGPVQADMLRLNMAIPPTTDNPSNLGLIGMDPAGSPTGEGYSTTSRPSSCAHSLESPTR